MLDKYIKDQIIEIVNSEFEKRGISYSHDNTHFEGKDFSREEAAKYLSVSIGTIDNYVRWNLLPKHKLGVRMTRFKKSDLDNLIKKNK